MYLCIYLYMYLCMCVYAEQYLAEHQERWLQLVKSPLASTNPNTPESSTSSASSSSNCSIPITITPRGIEAVGIAL